MAQEASSRYQAYLGESRLRMTIPGRILVRVISYVTYLVLVGATVTFLLSDIRPVFAAGLFLFLVLADRMAHRGEGDLPIPELPAAGRVNLAEIMSPKAYSVIERAFDRSLLAKKNFYLEAAGRLLEFPQIEEGLRRLDVKPEEFKQKLDAISGEAIVVGSGVRENTLLKAEALAAEGFRQALAAGHQFIMIDDLFSALVNVKDESIASLIYFRYRRAILSGL
jgi:hypothetical protein